MPVLRTRKQSTGNEAGLYDSECHFGILISKKVGEIILQVVDELTEILPKILTFETLLFWRTHLKEGSVLKLIISMRNIAGLLQLARSTSGKLLGSSHCLQ